MASSSVRLGFVLIASVVAAGCAGSGTSVPKSAAPRVAQPGPTHTSPPFSAQNAITLATIAKMGPIRKAPFPPPVDLRVPGVAKIIKDSTPQLNQPPPYPLPPLAGYATLHLLGAHRHTRNNTGGVNDPTNDPNRNHVNRGPTITADSLYIGEEAINTAYTNVSVPANWTVYSPTLRPPGTPSCLEVTTIYGPNNYAALGIWNWCPDGQAAHNNFYVTKTIDSTFVNTYVSQNSNGNPAYDVQTEQYADGTWHVFLYNWPQAAYEEFNGWNADNSPYYPSNTAYTGAAQDGWDFFEFYAPTNTPCANFPTMEAERMQVLELGPSSNVWKPVYSSMVNELGPSECFNDVNGVSPFYQYAYGGDPSLQPNGYQWQVASF